MDTGLGDSLVSYAMLCAYMRECRISKYTMSVNGDDSVTIIEKADFNKLLGMDYFKKFGFVMKFDHTEDFQKMDFCQTRPVQTDYGWMMARGPRRLLQRAGWSVKKFGKRCQKSYVKSLGLGEMAINYGLPIGYKLGRMMYDAGGGARLLPVDRKRFVSQTKQRFWQVIDVPSISMATRISYQTAWDLSPCEQLEIESKLKIVCCPNVTPQQQWEYERILDVRL
jgi:hypothetical protein